MKSCLICLLLLDLAACGRRHVSVPLASTVPPPEASYLDLEPGWRLRAVLPLWKPGTTDHEFTAQQSDEKTRTITLHSNDNFLGYETQRYLVRKHLGALQIRFDSADVTKGGVVSPLDRGSQKLFRIPGKTKCVRLVFLERASQADHNMAVLATANESVLNEATRTIEADPASCPNLHLGYCSWIPAGIAIRAEMPVRTADGVSWQPAR